jgi:hypothetical protein
MGFLYSSSVPKGSHLSIWLSTVWIPLLIKNSTRKRPGAISRKYSKIFVGIELADYQRWVERNGSNWQTFISFRFSVKMYFLLTISSKNVLNLHKWTKFFTFNKASFCVRKCRLKMFQNLKNLLNSYKSHRIYSYTYNPVHACSQKKR